MQDSFEPTPMTEDEYLAFEPAALDRHEYRDGVVYRVPGSNHAKAAIGARLCCTLLNAVDRKGYQVYPCMMRVYIPTSQWYVYPDCSVVSSPGRFKKNGLDDDNLLNPRVVVRVYTPLTEDYDRGDKFTHYKTIPSLAHYMLVSQDEKLVDVFSRQDDGSWTSVQCRAGDKIALPAIECEVEVDQVYAGVFEAEVVYVFVD